MVNSTAKLGSALGSLSKGQSSIRENLSADEASAQFLIFNTETLVVSGSLRAIKKEITGVFTVYHPVYGIVGPSGSQIYFPMVLGHPVYGVLGSGYLSSASDLESTSVIFTTNF